MSIDTEFIAGLNPVKGLNERPSTDTILEIKMLMELAGKEGKNLDVLMGPGSARNIQILLQNEFKYVGAALNLLFKNQRIRDALGGATYANLAKLTGILKRRADKLWIDRFLTEGVMKMDSLSSFDSTTTRQSFGDWLGPANDPLDPSKAIWI